MKLTQLCFALLVFIAFFCNAVFSLVLNDKSEEEALVGSGDDDMHNDALHGSQGLRRFLYDQGKFYVDQTNCKKNPGVCRKKGSPGPDCCGKICVNVMTDPQNCGMCKKKCKYSQTCCKGKCVNTFFDKDNCGKCKKKCKKGEHCRFGMCNYA